MIGKAGYYTEYHVATTVSAITIGKIHGIVQQVN